MTGRRRPRLPPGLVNTLRNRQFSEVLATAEGRGRLRAVRGERRGGAHARPVRRRLGRVPAQRPGRRRGVRDAEELADPAGHLAAHRAGLRLRDQAARRRGVARGGRAGGRGAAGQRAGAPSPRPPSPRPRSGRAAARPLLFWASPSPAIWPRGESGQDRAPQVPVCGRLCARLNRFRDVSGKRINLDCRQGHSRNDGGPRHRGMRRRAGGAGRCARPARAGPGRPRQTIVPFSLHLTGPAAYPGQMTLPVQDGYAAFEDHQTWYRVVGDLGAARAGQGPAPLVTLHGGPGATHDYLLSHGRPGARRPRGDLLRPDGQRELDPLPGPGRRLLHRRPVRPRAERPARPPRHRRPLPPPRPVLGRDARPGARHRRAGRAAVGGAVEHRRLVRPLRGRGQQAPRRPAARGGQTLRRHEEARTTSNPEYAEACDVYYSRHLCRLDEWPAEVLRSFELIDTDPTVYHTTNGPSEFHVIGSFRDWTARDRLSQISGPGAGDLRAPRRGDAGSPGGPGLRNRSRPSR